MHTAHRSVSRVFLALVSLVVLVCPLPLGTGLLTAAELHWAGEWVELSEINELQPFGIQMNAQQANDTVTVGHGQGYLGNAVLTEWSLTIPEQPAYPGTVWDGYYSTGGKTPLGVFPDTDLLGGETSNQLRIITDLAVAEYSQGYADADAPEYTNIPFAEAVQDNLFSATLLWNGMTVIVDAPINGPFIGTKMIRISDPSPVLHVTGEWVDLSEVNELQPLGIQMNAEQLTDTITVGQEEGRLDGAVLTEWSLRQPTGSDVVWDFFRYYAGEAPAYVEPDDVDGVLSSDTLTVHVNLPVGTYTQGLADADEPGYVGIPFAEAAVDNVFSARFAVPGGVPGLTTGYTTLIVDAPIDEPFIGTKAIRFAIPVPEPSSVALLLLGMVALALRHHRRRFALTMSAIAVAAISFFSSHDVTAAELHLTGTWDDPTTIHELQPVGIQMNAQLEFDTISLAHVQGFLPDSEVIQWGFKYPTGSDKEWDGYVATGGETPSDVFPDSDIEGGLAADELRVYCSLLVGEYNQGYADADYIDDPFAPLPLSDALDGTVFSAHVMVPGGVPGFTNEPTTVIVDAPINEPFIGTQMIRIDDTSTVLHLTGEWVDLSEINEVQPLGIQMEAQLESDTIAVAHVAGSFQDAVMVSWSLTLPQQPNVPGTVWDGFYPTGGKAPINVYPDTNLLGGETSNQLKIETDLAVAEYSQGYADADAPEYTNIPFAEAVQDNLFTATFLWHGTTVIVDAPIVEPFNGTKMIRIIGVIPEPSSFVLLLIGVLYLRSGRGPSMCVG